jgi:hypothetical protein
LVDKVAAVRSSPSFVFGHTIAARTDGTAWAWGANASGALGDRTTVDRLVPRAIPGVANVAGITAGYGYSMVHFRSGGVAGWGRNHSGFLADGTFAHRFPPGAALGIDGIGLLDLTPADPAGVPAEMLPPLALLARSRGEGVVQLDARFFVKPEDAGKLASIYVFALAPATLVKAGGEKAQGFGHIAKGDADTPVQCVLAQLTSGGQLTGVSASNMQAYVTGVLSGGEQAVTLLDGTPTANIAGATFYLGYGASAEAMLASGRNRSVATLQSGTECKPQAPQTGWWWNPAEGGRGYSVEVQGNHIFFAAFHYEVSGRATWHVATGETSLDGSLYANQSLYAARAGQVLGGPYPGKPALSQAGQVTLAFSEATRGTMIWPGGVVPIERMGIVPGGLEAAPRVNQPESGWWWNPNEDGRGFFMEWQNGSVDIAGYMYDEQGNSVWYLGVYETPDIRAINGSWWSYANGQTMLGAYKPATRISDNVAPVSVTFSGPDTAIMTLPNGRTTALRRHRF